MALDNALNAEAGPSSAPTPSSQAAGASSVRTLTPGESPYHESSQFRHWRYSPSQLVAVRAELNEKCVEVVLRNQELEKQAQLALNHIPAEDIPSTAYLSVSEELLLVRYYCINIAIMCRTLFGLPEVVESTAISYLKRFYLKNSVMEWHPKTMMPTCLFLASKTTNHPILIDHFISKFSKLKQSDVLDTEFILAQSLGFEFWVRGAEKAVWGWQLEFQEEPRAPIEAYQSALMDALKALEKSRLTDAEFLYTPSQIGLACWRTASRSSVDSFLDWRYTPAQPTKKKSVGENGSKDAGGNGDAAEDTKAAKDEDGEGDAPIPYGMERSRLEGILDEIQSLIGAVPDEKGDLMKAFDTAQVKRVDKRLKMCTNPEKTPGTALFIKRKQEQDAAEAESRTAKSLKTAQSMSERDSVFGDVLLPAPGKAGAGTGVSLVNKLGKASPALGEAMSGRNRVPLSPRVTIPSPRTSARRAGLASGIGSGTGAGAGAGGQTPGVMGAPTPSGGSEMDDDTPMAMPILEQETGMGVRDEAMGLIVGGEGLKHVGEALEDSD